MAGKGGARPGAGRKKKPTIPSFATKDIAEQVLTLTQKPIHGTTKEPCRCEVCTWWYFLHVVKDERIRFEALDKLTNRKYGRAAQRVMFDPLAFDPNAPLKVIIEHIGRAPDKTAAKAK